MVKNIVNSIFFMTSLETKNTKGSETLKKKKNNQEIVGLLSF